MANADDEIIVVKTIDQLNSYFYHGFSIFTNDSKENGIEDHLITAGLLTYQEFSYPDVIYLSNLKNGVLYNLIRYYPIPEKCSLLEKMPQFAKLKPGYNTKIDFVLGSAPVIYDVSKSLLDAGFLVAVQNLNPEIVMVTQFKKEDNLYKAIGQIQCEKQEKEEYKLLKKLFTENC